MSSKVNSVAAYLAELPPERQAAMSAVRKTILDNLDKDYEEGIQYGMIGYYVPHRVYPAGYHCDPRQPLPFACLASRKGYMTLHLPHVYGDSAERERLVSGWQKAGKKLDMGKGCIRFKRLEDVPLDVLGEYVRRTPAKAMIEFYETAMKTNAQRKTKGPPSRTKTTRKAAAPSRKKVAGRAKATSSRKAKR